MFFFFVWGTDEKTETIYGLDIDLGIKEDGKKHNIIYHLERTTIFWIIPLGRWSITGIEIQSIKSGNIYFTDGDSKKDLKELYWKLKKYDE